MRIEDSRSTGQKGICLTNEWRLTERLLRKRSQQQGKSDDANTIVLKTLEKVQLEVRRPLTDVRLAVACNLLN